jgi:small GTP-binding protein
MNLRNVAIIAHVDHGKTTLVDRLLQQSGTYRDNQRVVERAMDSNDLERERGITILAKAASVQWKDTRINIVDTPGHADFGGEVERILNMVDGALVLVDAAEGPLPQTKFVVSKALKVGLKPIVVINKVDRPDARPTEVINEVFDLFAALDASEEQLDFPILYGSAKQGWMAESPDGSHDAGMQPLFDLILRHVAPPTVEDGPFRMIGTILDRLLREAEGNVALRVTEAADRDSMEVSGRGELQLAILIETMRREGFELSVSRPRVVLKKDDATGEWQEPIEEVTIDVDEEHSGVVVQKMSERKAEMIEMRPSGGNRLRLVFYAPTRGLIGYQGELLTDTRGTAIMNRLFHGYAPYKGDIQGRRNGVLISNDQGEAVAYAMFKLEDRGPMMIEPGWKVYKGMIVGEHTRENDLEINILKGKQLTNIRTTSKDEAVRLTPPIRMTLEKALAYIEDDELVEVTPKSIRLRKKFLDANERKRAEKSKEAVA